MIKQDAARRNRVLIGIYNSSWQTSMVALSIVCALELFMLVYTLINPPLFGQYIQTYRMFYVALLTASVVYIVLNLNVKKDIEHKFRWLNIANPIYAAFFFAWSLGITYFDAAKYGTVDPIVFMTFSLTVPLSFYLFPSVYMIIVIVVDSLMLYLSVAVSGSLGPMINLSIFFIFQIVLGVNFLRLKMRLAERIVQERENAELDVLTGFPNRRAYEAEIRKLSGGPLRSDLFYIAIDLNELKEINDSLGHDAGDRLIIGAAQCIRECFEDRGKAYRIGGDEFAALVHAQKGEMAALLEAYERCMAQWSEHNGMALSAACGCVCCGDYQGDITEIRRMADRKMYEAKSLYYQEKGRDRRRPK